MERYWRILTGILKTAMQTCPQLTHRFKTLSNAMKTTGRATGGGNERSRRITGAKPSGRQTDHTPQININPM